MLCCCSVDSSPSFYSWFIHQALFFILFDLIICWIKYRNFGLLVHNIYISCNGLIRGYPEELCWFQVYPQSKQLKCPSLWLDASVGEYECARSVTQPAIVSVTTLCFRSTLLHSLWGFSFITIRIQRYLFRTYILRLFVCSQSLCLVPALNSWKTTWCQSSSMMVNVELDAVRERAAVGLLHYCLGFRYSCVCGYGFLSSFINFYIFFIFYKNMSKVCWNSACWTR